MNNQTKLLTFLLMLFFLHQGMAQNGRISGVTQDVEGKILDFASVVLLRLPDSSQVTAATSNEKGEFVFASLAKGEYVVVAFLVGYTKTFSRKLICDGYSTQQISLSLKNASLETQEVTVEGQKSLVRQEPDKMVVDVENQVSNSGLTTLDVLRKSPGITVGKDGNISIKGKNGVQIMLDDKPMYMSEMQLANLLKSIPSDQVKEIEIITSPSAKYDAVGSSGIINIRLKKAAYEGLTGSLNASYGQGYYYKSNAGVNVAYKKKRLTLNSGYQYNRNKEMEVGVINRAYLNPSDPYRDLLSDGYGSANAQSHSGLFNGEYKFHKSHSVSFDFTGSANDETGSGRTYSSLVRQNGEPGTSSFTQGSGSYGRSNVGIGGGYKAKLDTNGTLLSIYANYNANTRYQDRSVGTKYIDSMGMPTNQTYIFSQKSDNTSDQYSVKVDYTISLTKKIKLETGAKSNGVTNTYPTVVSILQNGTQQEIINKFVYKEQVYAAYGMLSGKWDKWKAQAGLRLENTEVNGYQESTDSSFTRNYTNLFPSGNLSFSLNKKNSFSLLYSRRIKRPEAYHLNPVAVSQDPYTSWGGNPYLLPQYADNFEFAYSMFGGVLITTLSYARNTNHISFVLKPEANSLVTRSTFMNMKIKENFGLSFTMNKMVNKWWTTSNFVNLFHARFEGGPGYENMNYAQAAWTANSTQTIKLPKEFSLELSGNYEAPKAQNAFGINLETWQLNTGLSKKLWAGKAVAKIAFSDIFWKSRWATEGTVDNIVVYNNYKEDTRSLMFTFTYKFGNKVSITQQ